jgi:anaerobic selenocysteine-containing dehydrogenase
VGFRSNLIMSVPSAAKWESALTALPYYVHVGPAMTEMAAYADIILPASTFLEEWGYESALPSSGYAEARIKQPVISEPRFESRSVARILFEMASRMGPPVATPFTDITADAGSFAAEFVKYRTGSFVSWDEFRSSGVWEGGPYQYQKYDEIFHTPSGKFEFKSDHLEGLLDVKLPGEDTEYPLMLGIYRPVLEIRSGSQNYPWAQEVLLVMQGRGWGNTVEVSRDSAREWGIGDGDRVVVQSVFGELEAQVKVIEGIRPGVIAIAEGEGHWFSGRFADGLGVNPNDIIVTAYDEETGQPSYFSTRVRIRRA